MSIPEIDHSQIMDAEAQLQQELLSLFAVDTQTYLEKYIQISQNLQSDFWRTDIQELYRCIHTIKGEAVTVGAEAVLYVATALENMLSDLRYLELAPAQNDRHLSQILLESAELLAATLELQQSEDAEPIFKQVQILHKEIRERYLPQWSEHRQLHQEFAEQGLDLVVLELEIALERSPDRGVVPAVTLDVGRQTLAQLQQIGQELQLGSGWTELLAKANELFKYPECGVWRSEWLRLFRAFKTCAKQSGEAVSFQFEHISIREKLTDNFDHQLAFQDSVENMVDANKIENSFLNNLGNIETFLEESSAIDLLSDFNQIQSWLDQSNVVNGLNESQPAQPQNSTGDETTIISPPEILVGIEDLISDFHQVQSWLDQPVPDDIVNEVPPSQLKEFEIAEITAISPPKIPAETPQAESDRSTPTVEKVQIPVALEKLDQSAQYLVETLLALRTTQGIYQTLQTQITQLVTLAQEGTQYITHLRQIQDDYTLLDQLSQSKLASSQDLSLERYRQGYTIVNRLLETSLRLSEIGAETGKTSQQIAEYLQDVDQNVLKLQNTIKDSRSVPFQNLGFRAKAILRDLTTRYDKPAQLLIQGEKTELDVSTVRDLEPAILHLIRNAYDHGLECPAERLAQGKPEQGTITLSLYRQGNLFQFELKDDGRGIDAQAIHDRAKKLGLPFHSAQTSAEILAVICQPGFSSQSQVSEISGRGIGMDIVAAQVSRLGGRLSLQTTPRVGTTFRFQFPVPRLLVPCVLLRAGNVTFAIPDDNINTIALFSSLNPSPIKDANSPYSWMVHDADGSTPIVDLVKYWHPNSGDRSIADTAVCLSIRSDHSEQTIWLMADELIEQSDQIINPLPSPMIAPDGLIGVSLQVNGSLAPVLEARLLVDYLLASPSLSTKGGFAGDSLDNGEKSVVQTILVVDDAALMRRRLESSLNTYGYSTHSCTDGQDAWNWLQTNSLPSLVITDIEMPNMDGFTLIDHCRQAGITVPILVISSRLSEEWSREAKRLGATDYLTKGFSTVELIKRVSTLLSK